MHEALGLKQRENGVAVERRAEDQLFTAQNFLQNLLEFAVVFVVLVCFAAVHSYPV